MKEMDVNDALLMILLAVNENFQERRAFQKIAYLSSVKLNFDMGFFAHYYGPYSKIVASQIENLSTFGFINEKNLKTNNDRILTFFELNDDGKKITKSIKKKYREEYKTIKLVVDACKKEKYDYNVLSWSAKVHYIMPKGKSVSVRQISELAKEYGWKLSKDDINNAFTLLTSLELITDG